MQKTILLLKTVSDSILYYFFLIDLYLLAFFSKKYPYLVFIFAFFFGNFGYTDGLTQSQFYAKLLCFLFCSYLISASVTVFIAFNIPSSKEYLYNLLGKDFVKSKIGNPALDQLLKFGGFAAGGYAANEMGRVADQYMGMKSAISALQVQLDKIESSPYLSPKEKAKATKEAFKLYAELAHKTPEGTLDRITKVEAYKGMTDRVGKTIQSIARIWGGEK